MATARVNNCFDSIIENGVDLLPKEVALAIAHFDEAPRKVHTNVKRYLKQVAALIDAVKASGDAELLELLGMKPERKARVQRETEVKPSRRPRITKEEDEKPARTPRKVRGEESAPVRKSRKVQNDIDDFDLDEDDKPARSSKKERASDKIRTVKSPRRPVEADDDFEDDEVPASRIKRQASSVRRPKIR